MFLWITLTPDDVRVLLSLAVSLLLLVVLVAAIRAQRKWLHAVDAYYQQRDRSQRSLQQQKQEPGT